MEIQIPKKAKSRPTELAKPIISLARPEKEEMDPLEYVDCTCHNTPGDSSSGKYVIKIPRFGSGTPEEWIISMNLVQKSLVGQNVTTGPPMYKCMERLQTVDTKAKFRQQANLAGTHTVANFTSVVDIMTAHIFPTYTNHDQRQYMQRYLRKPPEMKVRTFTTRLLQLNAYLANFPPDWAGQTVNPIPADNVKEILYHTMPNTWKKKMVEQGYNYLDSSIQQMTEFFETRVENQEKSNSKKESKKNQGKQNHKKNKKRKHSSYGVSENMNSQGSETGKTFCQYHGMCGHTTNECTLAKTLVQKKKLRKYKANKERKYTKHEVNVLVERKVKKAM